mgnify:CR=1 FL=1
MKRMIAGVAVCLAAIAGSTGCRAAALPGAALATRVAATVEAVSATATAVHRGFSAADVEPTPILVPAEARDAVRLATEDLARRLGVRPAAIRPVRVQAVDWSDTSLGCPRPDMVYAQVITPGYVVILSAQGRDYEYHTDAGRFVVWCEE